MKKRTIEKLENGNILVRVAILFRSDKITKKIIVPDIPENDSLVLAIARGRRWQRYIDEGRFENAVALARELGRDTAKVAGTIRFARLAPAVIHRILTGNIPVKVNMNLLHTDIPEIWSEQYEYIFGEKMPE